MHDTEPETEPLALRRRSRWLVLLAWLTVLVVVAAVAGYVTTHPDPLPRTEGVVTATTRTGEPVFVGVFGADADFERTLEISGVKVYATSPVPVKITPHLCHDGSVGVTTDPLVFCSEVGPTEDVRMGEGDEILLEVVGDQPGVVTIDRVRVAYREGFTWATQRAGQPSVVTIVGSGGA